MESYCRIELEFFHYHFLQKGKRNASLQAIEKWEEDKYALKTSTNASKHTLNSNGIYFIPSAENDEVIQNPVPMNKGKQVLQAFGQKTRILKRFIGTFFSVA